MTSRVLNLHIYLLNYPNTHNFSHTHTNTHGRQSASKCVCDPLLALVSIMTFGVMRSAEEYKHKGRAATNSQARIPPWPATKSQTRTHTQLCLDKSNNVIQMPAEDIWFE